MVFFTIKGSSNMVETDIGHWKKTHYLSQICLI